MVEVNEFRPEIGDLGLNLSQVNSGEAEGLFAEVQGRQRALHQRLNLI